MATARREAAAILRRIAETLPQPANVAAYLRGYADALSGPQRNRKRSSRS